MFWFVNAVVGNPPDVGGGGGGGVVPTPLRGGMPVSHWVPEQAAPGSGVPLHVHAAYLRSKEE